MELTRATAESLAHASPELCGHLQSDGAPSLLRRGVMEPAAKRFRDALRHGTGLVARQSGAPL